MPFKFKNKLASLFAAALIIGGEAKAQTAEQTLAQHNATTADTLKPPILQADVQNYFAKQGLEALPAIVMPGQAIYFLHPDDARKVTPDIVMVLLQPAPTEEERAEYPAGSLYIPQGIKVKDPQAADKTIRATCSMAFFAPDSSGKLTMQNLIGSSVVKGWEKEGQDLFWTFREVSFGGALYTADFYNQDKTVTVESYTPVKTEKPQKPRYDVVFPGEQRR